MPLTPVARRRATAVLIVVAVVVVACFATGNGVPGALLVALTPLLVYRVTGHSWSQARAWATGREPMRAPPAAPPRARRHRPAAPAPDRAATPARPPNRFATILLIVVAVPAGLGLLSALAGRVAGSEDIALPIGILMTLTWTAIAAMISGMVLRVERDRMLVALAAGAATVASVVVWVGVVFGS